MRLTPIRQRRRSRRSRGVALVEFALVAPVLFLIIFGIIEFGYAFVQYLDVKHGAREAGRLAAVNYGSLTGDSQSDEIIIETCTRIDQPDGVVFEITHPGGSGIGQTAEVSVERTYDSLTGFFNFLEIDLESTVEVRLEQAATWTDRETACP